MFPNCSIFGSHLKHSMVENSPTLLRNRRLKNKNLAARMATDVTSRICWTRNSGGIFRADFYGDRALIGT
jgi:hypothetical protein